MKDNIHAQTEQRDRPRNEDRSWAGKLRLSDKTDVFAAMVADGVGGHRFGAEVAEMAIGALKHAIERATARDFAGDEEVRVWLETWAPKLQEEVQAAYPLGFSTLCAAIQVGKEAVLLSVGDSPVFQVGSGTGIRRVFEPHTRGQVRIKNGEDEDNINARDFSVLVRAVGLQQDGGGPLLDFQRVEVTEPTWFLLGSDGVFNYLEGIELFKTISAMKRPGASDIAASLLARSLENGRRTGKHLDNATIAVLGVLQKTGRKRRKAVGQAHVRTGGSSRRLWIVGILVALLVALVAVLAAGFFFRDAFTSEPTAVDGATSCRAIRAEPVARDSEKPVVEDASPGETLPPPPAACTAPETMSPQAISEEDTSLEEEILPSKVVLYLEAPKTVVTERRIAFVYFDGTLKCADRNEDYYVIPDAENVSLFELGSSHNVYEIARKEKNDKGISVWHLLLLDRGSYSREYPSGELLETRGGSEGDSPSLKENAEVVESALADQIALDTKTASQGAEPKTVSEPGNTDGMENGRMPASDSSSTSQKKPAQNFIALQLPNEAKEYRGAVTIEFSNGKPADISGERPYSLFRIGSRAVSEIVSITVEDNRTVMTYTNKGKWRFSNEKHGQLPFEYTLITLDKASDNDNPIGTSPGSQHPPAGTSSSPQSPKGMTETGKTGRSWP